MYNFTQIPLFNVFTPNNYFTFTNQFRTCYNANPRPDALMKEQLVEMTNLSPRVIRVWFQNKRCKDKKKTIQMKLQMQQEKVCRCDLCRFCLNFSSMTFRVNGKVNHGRINCKILSTCSAVKYWIRNCLGLATNTPLCNRGFGMIAICQPPNFKLIFFHSCCSTGRKKNGLQRLARYSDDCELASAT